jgi:ribosomal protein L29
MEELREMETGELLSFQLKQRLFVERLQKDSLSCGAIPNPHAIVKVPKMKIIPYVFHFMFLNGLPNGWRK